MKYLVVFFGLLIAYTLIYAGISHYWPTYIAGVGNANS